MGLSVQVRTFTGQVEATCTHPAILALCRRASELELSMLGHVDQYDDTVFNASQMRVVKPELTVPDSGVNVRIYPADVTLSHRGGRVEGCHRLRSA